MDGILNLSRLKQANISLRAKTIGLFLILLIGFVLMLYVLARGILLNSFETIEHNLAEEHLQRVANLLADEFADLRMTSEDWAFWDDTYTFVEDGNQAYIDDNLADSTFESLRLNMLLLMDSDGSIVYGKAYRLEEHYGFELSSFLIEQYLNLGPLRNYSGGLEDPDQFRSGILLSPRGPMVIAMQPVLPSNRQGTSNGLLFMGRFLDEAALANLATTAGVTLDLHYFSDNDLPSGFQEARARLDGEGDHYVAPLDSNTLGAYTLVNDITGQPALILQITIPRDVYRRGADTIYFFLIALFVGGLMLLAGTLYILERQVLARVLRLHSLTQAIESTGILTRRIPVDGRDELSTLASSMNGMLDTIQRTQHFLAENQRRTQTIISSISDVIYVSNSVDGVIVSYDIPSPQIMELTGYPVERFQDGGAFWRSLIVPEDRERAFITGQDMLSGAYDEAEYRIITADGTERWIRDSAHVETREDGSLVAYGVLSDITARKAYQESLTEREETARAFQEHLKTLLEVSVELSNTATPDDLYRQTVELGYRRLGFERIELFLLENDGDMMVGTYGIDREGNLNDARALRRPVADDPAIAAALKNRQWTYVRSKAKTSDGRADPDRTSNTFVPLWVDTEAVGWLAVDTRENRADIKPYYTELLSLYSTTVGYLIMRARAQTALRESEARHRALFENAHDAIFVLRDSVFVDCNPRVLDLFGYSREQIIGQSPYHFSPPRQPDGQNSREKARKLLKAALEGSPQLFEWRHMRSDGTLFDAEITLSRMGVEEDGVVLAMLRDITDRKRAERALRESEMLYSTLFNRMPVELYRTDLDGKLLDVNPALVQMLGYSQATDLGDITMQQLFVSDQRFKRWQARIGEADEVRDFEVQLRRQDGSTFWAMDTSRLVRDEAGNPQYYEGHIRDITTRKQAQEELAEERNLLRTLVDSLPDRIYVKNMQGEMLLANSAFALAAGFNTSADVIGKTDFEVYPESLAEKNYSDDKQVMQSGVALLNRIEPAYLVEGGDKIWLTSTKVPLRNAENTVVGLVSVGHDITALREIQEALSQSQERLNLALQAAGLGLWDWYISSNRVVFNERWAEISGYSLEDLGDEPSIWETLVHPDDLDEVKTQLDAHLAGETPIFEAEYRLATPDGTIKWVLDRGKVMHRDAEGNPLRMTGTLGDITQRKEAETEREQMLGQMRTRAKELATVAEVGQQLTKILDIDQLLWELCDVVKERFDLYHAHVYLLSDDGKRLDLAAGFGEGGRRMVEVEHFIPLSHENSLVARAARAHEVVVVNDVRLDKGFLPNVFLPLTRAEMALPMVIAGELIGVLDVQDTRVGRFSEEDIHIQSTLAAQLAIAVANARLFSENARRLAIIEHSNDAIALIDAHDINVSPHYINPAGLRLTGFDSMEMVSSMTIDEFYAPEYRDYIHDTVVPEIEASGAWRGEMLLQNHDGTKIPVEQTVFMIYDEQGKPRDIATIITDITDRKHAENALRRANRAYRTLSNCNQVMVGATNELSLLREICETIVESGGYRMSWVGLISPGAENPTLATPVARAGNDPGYLDRFLEMRKQYPDWDDPSRRAIDSRVPVMIRDMAEGDDFPRDRALANEHGFRSLIALPLVSGDNALGALNVFADVTNAFDEHEIALLTELANDLAYGITVLRTRLERQAAVEQTQQLNLQLALRNRQLLALYDAGRTLMATLDVDQIYRVLYQYVVQPVFGAQIMLVTSYDSEQNHMVCEFAIVDDAEQDISHLKPALLAANPEHDSPTSKTIRTGQPSVISLPSTGEEMDMLNCEFHFEAKKPPQAAMYVPMIISGAVTGVIGVLHHAKNAFDDHDVRMLSAIVNQAAVAIQNARLFAAERDQRSLAEALQAATSAVNSTLDPDVVLDRILANIQRVVPHDAASIMLIEGDVWRVVRHIGFNGRDQVDFIHNMHLSKRKTDEEYQVHLTSGKPILIEDTYQSAYWQRFPETDWIRSYIGAPIRVGDSLVGVLNLDSAKPGFFTEQHARRAQAFADQVAVAVQNAQLFAAEHEQRQFAESLRDVAAMINVSLDRDHVLTELLANIKLVIPHDAATLMLLQGGKLVVARATGFEDYGLAEWVQQLSLDAEGHEIVGKLMRTGETAIINDTANDPGWEHFPGTEWQRACVTAPIRWEGQAIGFLNLYSTEPSFFTEKHAEHLQAFAYQASNAIRNAQLFDAEREQRVLAEALRDTIAVINSTLDPAQVLDRILNNVERVVPHDAANIMLVENDSLVVARAHGYEERGIAGVDERWRVPLDWSSLLHDIVREGQGLLLSDTRQESLWSDGDQNESAWIRATLKAPITLGNQVIGILNLDTAEPNAFTQEHYHLLQIFADYAAAAIRNARLFASEREQRVLSDVLRDTAETLGRSLEFEEVLDHILVNVGRVFPHDASNVMLIDEDTDEIYVVGHRGYEERGLASWVDSFRIEVTSFHDLHTSYETGEPIIIPDTMADPNWVRLPELEWIRAHATVPFSDNDRVIGFLSLESETAGFFHPGQASVLRVFANQAAIAVRNSRLFTAERDQRQFAEALRDTAAAINRTLEFDMVLDFVLANTRRVLPHDAANIMLLEDGIARVVRGHGYDQYGVGDYVRNLRFVAKDVASWRTMLETGTPFAIPDTLESPDWPKDVPGEFWIRSTVKAPIRVEGRTIGIVHLDSDTPGTFTQQDAERLQAFADQAAVALRNAEFFASEHAQRTLAEALRDSAAAINSTLELANVLDRILIYVGRVVPYDAANVLLIEGNEVRIAAQYPIQTDPEAQAWIESFRFNLAETANLKRMCDSGEPAIESHAKENPEWVPTGPLAWIESSAGAPIRHEGQVIGFITIDSKVPDFFNVTHAERLQSFADQAAIAIRNAQLFAAVQQHATELEQRVAERTYEVEQHSAQLRAILDSITEGVIYDEKLAVKYTNRALMHLTGFEGDEFTRYLEILRSDKYTQDEFERLIQKIFTTVENRGVWKGDLWIKRKDLSQFEAALTVTEVRNVDGDIVGAVSVLRDVSQEKELQRQRDRFIASASHELRTPLTNFKTRLYLIKAQPNKAVHHLTILNQVANTMVDLVGNLLDVSRFERGVIQLHRRRTLLQDLIVNVVEIQQPEAEHKGIALVADLPSEALYASVDPARMQQVVTNLIANAINYTPEEGTITIKLEQAGQHVLMHVSDTGIGIDTDQVAHIFEPFFRANEEAAEGTGLGLTIAKEIVHLHDGEISVTSAKGTGSTFTVTLDLTD